MREKSIITDLMFGQYKSKITCPTCGKVSVTFDPFSVCTLPIP
jgi:ubiquitin C-terminal hydrolase